MGLASRGLRDLGSGPERIDDPAELAAVRRRARAVTLKSLGAALAVAALLSLL